jgi:DNA polymerase I
MKKGIQNKLFKQKKLYSNYIENNHKTLLVDGNNIMNILYYGTNVLKLTNSTGIPTNVIYLFSKRILNLIDDFSEVGVVFDSPGRTKRKELYNDYKIHRKKMEEVKKYIYKRYSH